jgi:hypothetical protein
MKVCLPSMLYILQNNLFYTAASHLNAATFMASTIKKHLKLVLSIQLKFADRFPAQNILGSNFFDNFTKSIPNLFPVVLIDHFVYRCLFCSIPARR